MGDFREVTPGGKPLKRVYVAIMLWFVGRAIQAAAVVDDDVKKEFENLPDGPTMIVGKNRRGKVKYLGWNPKGRLIDLKMKIKNLEAAILLPYGLEYNRHKNGHLTAELLLPLTGVDVYTKTPRDGRMDEVIARVRQLNQDLHEAAGIPAVSKRWWTRTASLWCLMKNLKILLERSWAMDRFFTIPKSWIMTIPWWC